MKRLALFAGLFAGVAAAQPNDGAALAEFQKIVASCTSALKAEVPTVAPHPSKEAVWVKKAIASSEVTYDVKRTDSLVSPFSGSIVVTYLSVSETAPSREEAEALVLDPAGTAFLREESIRYAYQGGAWATVGGTSTSRFRTRAGMRFEPPMVLQNTRSQALDLRAPLKACVR